MATASNLLQRASSEEPLMSIPIGGLVVNVTFPNIPSEEFFAFVKGPGPRAIAGMQATAKFSRSSAPRSTQPIRQMPPGPGLRSHRLVNAAIRADLPSASSRQHVSDAVQPNPQEPTERGTNRAATYEEPTQSPSQSDVRRTQQMTAVKRTTNLQDTAGRADTCGVPPTPKSPAVPGSLLSAALDDLAAALRLSRRRVLLATPFMSFPVAQLLIRAADTGTAPTRRLLTAITVAGIEGGFLDAHAVEAFVDAGFEVRSLRNLHAKTVLVDDTWGLVGSGNLTVAGSDGGNAELGVVLSKIQTRRARRDYFDPWWAVAMPLDLPAMRRLARAVRPAKPQRHQREGQGGIFRTSAGAELESFSRDRSNSGYWLKIMYGNDGLSQAGGWRDVNWVSDAHILRNGVPIRRPTYAVGDHLVTYLSRVARPSCPAILRVTDEPRYDPNYVARRSPGDETRWAWVTPVELVAATAMSRAPTLADLGVAGRSVNQQGHIRLSPTQYRSALKVIRA
jgi:hypothetical protein